MASMLVLVVCTPSAHAADPLVCIEDVPPASANMWTGSDGAWSEPTNWSLGHAPTDTEVACVLDAADTPQVDADIDVAGLLVAGPFTIPSGRTVASRGILLADTAIVATGANLHIVGPTAHVSAPVLQLGGTLRVTGVVDLSSVNLSGVPGTVPTIDADGRIDISMGDLDGIRLAAGTELHGDVTVAGDVLVEGGASVTGTVTVEQPASGAATIAGNLGPESVLRLLGDADVGTGGAAAFVISVEDAALEVADATLTASFVGLTNGVLRVTGDGTLAVGSISSEGSALLDLASCAPRPAADITMTAVHAQITDLDCIDPAAGSTVDLDIEGGAWNAPAATIPGGTLDGGGILRLSGNLAFLAGTTLVDGATQLVAVGDYWNIAGTGTFTMVDLDLTSESGGVMHAGPGQVWRFIRPSDRSGQAMLVATTGDGLLEIHDAARRSAYLFPLPDMTRAVYYVDGVAYVPGQADPAPPAPPPTQPAPPADPTPPTPKPIVRTGSSRTDRYTGGALADILRGMGGNDVLRGLAGSDLLVGGLGNDRIECGTGLRDRALGGPGTDIVLCRDRGRGRDIIDCGPGRDRAIVDRLDIVRNCEVVLRR